ncbi:MAG: tryptophan--tRNA ligase [Candidatus Terrybacteria bacterium RIFCSPHIGHO2_01_FULL_48_17]|uniref:Tryptophan--tRNA ligase n=1 Tax=Candidatus Terrybacteria bacterium RIFCSPHIGHO2_01_FULL_48_17 TaxID=1802362 RepID=A0A1G2PHM6_9BACT|nr:MAG: tryptophan--tRNA ligase [Candidatus Terrybacteria bacterium RIFCSPHIGHO2_01_FULL_48_17]OHA53560.1 MAG: tryptophan--tRNA ligase [Candidatus Terrybacteria bacterium RIFCSPLOWO2_01_FULL_48_14]
MRILSGIQPSGTLHIGNYLGAIKQWIELQQEHECLFLIVDLHAITEPYEPKEMQQRTKNIALDYLALGLDPKRCTLFVQSHIPEHTELMWLLTTVAQIGELERMTQYKDKAQQFAKQGVNAGLLLYPVLMAADILLYKTEGVPVGEDQVQHLELTRTIAKRFNSRFGNLFPEPKAILAQQGARIMSLKEPTKKMSKSHVEDSYIALSDVPDLIRKKIKRAVTDSGTEIVYDPNGKPALSNLLTIFSAFSGKDAKELVREYRSRGYDIFKKELGEVVARELSLFQQKRKRLENTPEYIDAVLETGRNAARNIAQKTLHEVKEKMGLI